MSHSVKFDFKQSSVHKKGEGGRNIYTAIASTVALDRDKEILIPRGVITEHFMKNPVMLFIHNSRQLPVGRALSMDVTDESVKFDFEFYDDEVGRNVEKMYRTGFMNAFSVGFRPKAYVPVWDMPEEITSIDVELPDGTKTTIDFNKYPERPYGIIPKWELLEISPVPVPSNPEALLQRAKDEIVRKYVNSGNSKAAAGILDQTLNERLSKITSSIDSFIKALDEEVTVSNVVTYEKSEAIAETGFDRVAELATLAMACTEDGSGDKEKIDWAAFSKAFAWFNAEKADAFTSYKLMHHVALPNQVLALSKVALFESMAALLGSDKALTEIKSVEGEFGAVYEHLSKHYQDLGLIAPALDMEYSTDQLKAIAEGKDPNPTPESVEESESESEVVVPDEENLKAVVTSGLKSVEQKLDEFDTSMKIRMQVMVRMLEELSVDVASLKPQQPAPSEESTEDQDTKDFCAKLLDLKNLFNNATV